MRYSLEDEQLPPWRGVTTAEGARSATDSTVGEAFAEGLEWALAEAFRRWSPLVHTIALRTLGNPSDAEDVTQHVFVKAWRSHRTYDPSMRPLPAWLTGVTRHAVADRMAARTRERNLALRLVSMATPRHTDADAVADAVLVGSLLEQMPQPRRTILELAFLEQHTHAEIAARTGLPLGTVKSHVRRGLSHLRAELEVTDEPL